jgi:hypothetical protein
MIKKGIKKYACLAVVLMLAMSSMTVFAETKGYEYTLKGGAASSNMSSASKADAEQRAYVTAREYSKPYNVRVRFNGQAATALATVSANATYKPTYDYIKGVKGNTYNLYANSERWALAKTRVIGKWTP